MATPTKPATPAGNKTEALISEAEKCSSCKAPLDTTGLPKWCRECRNRWQRERRALENYRIDARSHAQGAREMKEMLAKMFDATGTAVYSAREVAGLIRRMDTPRLSSPDELQAREGNLRLLDPKNQPQRTHRPD